MPNSKSSHERINKTETGYCSSSRWGDRWVNWDGVSQSRCRRDHVNLETTVEAVPAFLQECLARQHLLPLQGWWAMPNSPEWAFMPVQSQMDGSGTLAQRTSRPLSANQSQLFIYDKNNQWRGFVHIPAALDKLSWEKVKERSAEVQLLHDW